jgi:hypothetical protein
MYEFGARVVRFTYPGAPIQDFNDSVVHTGSYNCEACDKSSDSERVEGSIFLPLRGIEFLAIEKIVIGHSKAGRIYRIIFAMFHHMLSKRCCSYFDTDFPDNKYVITLVNSSIIFQDSNKRWCLLRT